MFEQNSCLGRFGLRLGRRNRSFGRTVGLLLLVAPSRGFPAENSLQPELSQSSIAISNSPSSSSAESGPERLESNIRIVAETNAAPAGASQTNAPAKEKFFHWKFAWEGWNGLQMEIVQRTPLQSRRPLFYPLGAASNAPPLMHLEQVKMAATIGGRVEVDGAAFATSGTLTGFDDGIELRRLVVRIGGDCILVLPVTYLIELGYNGGGFALNKAYLLFQNIGILGDLQIGQFQAPMGLQFITSSRDISFMETAAPLQAIAPGVES